jgi:hypothetical protein
MSLVYHLYCISKRQLNKAFRSDLRERRNNIPLSIFPLKNGRKNFVLRLGFTNNVSMKKEENKKCMSDNGRAYPTHRAGQGTPNVILY